MWLSGLPELEGGDADAVREALRELCVNVLDAISVRYHPTPTAAGLPICPPA